MDVPKEFYARKGDFKVYLVDGGFVRTNLDLDFTVGGHYLVYPFIPNDEVWIDDAYKSKPDEVRNFLAHELPEVSLMAPPPKGKGMSYEQAHAIANIEELKRRKTKPTKWRLTLDRMFRELDSVFPVKTGVPVSDEERERMGRYMKVLYLEHTESLPDVDKKRIADRLCELGWGEFSEYASLQTKQEVIVKGHIIETKVKPRLFDLFGKRLPKGKMKRM